MNSLELKKYKEIRHIKLLKKLLIGWLWLLKVNLTIVELSLLPNELRFLVIALASIIHSRMRETWGLERSHCTKKTYAEKRPS